MSNEATDKQRLDFLQGCLGKYTGKVLVRNSVTGRGMRLEETSKTGAVSDVRRAIDNAMIAENPTTKPRQGKAKPGSGLRTADCCRSCVEVESCKKSDFHDQICDAFERDMENFPRVLVQEDG